MEARTDDDEHALPVRAHAQAAARTGRWERSASVHDGLEFAASVRSGTGRTPASRRALAHFDTDAAVRAEWDDADDLLYRDLLYAYAYTYVFRQYMF